MLHQLDSRDAFSVVTYPSSSETVIPMQRATDTNKAAAREAIETIGVVDDPEAVAASVDPATMPIIEKALSARALEEAAKDYETGGMVQAKQVRDRRSQAVRAIAAYTRRGDGRVARSRVVRCDRRLCQVAGQAKKAASVKAYELARRIGRRSIVDERSNQVRAR